MTTQPNVVLITGASAGMGMVTAQLLAANGYIVYGAARRADRMKALEAEGIRTLTMDVTNEASMRAGVEHILREQGHIDVLINNAGFGQYGALEDVPLDEARRQFEVNVFGAARLTQLVLPGMRERRHGKIVNISSIGGKFATPFGGWYHASKFALEALSDALRNEVKPFSIDVIVIEPGGVKSEWAGISLQQLLANSKGSAYSAMLKRFIEVMQATLPRNAEPMVIAKLILDGIRAKRPRFRYTGGHMAKQAVIARKLLSDRAFDWMIMGSLK